MLQITQKGDEIVIREMPVKKWVSSLLAAAFLFLFVYEVSMSEGLVKVAFGLGALVFFIVILAFQLHNPVTTVKINKRGKIVSVRKQSLIKYAFNVYSFDDIIGYIYIEAAGGANDETYQLIMPLKDGEKIALSIKNGSKNNDYVDAAETLNRCVFGTTGQIPFKMSFLNLD